MHVQLVEPSYCGYVSGVERVDFGGEESRIDSRARHSAEPQERKVIMVTETESVGQITQEEIDAVKAELLSSPDFDLDKLRNSNSAAITVMMPLTLRVLCDEAASEDAVANGKAADEGSTADWVRKVLAEKLNYTLPTKASRARKDKRSAEIQQRAQRNIVADMIKEARSKGIDLS